MINAILVSIYLHAQTPVVLPQTAKGIVVDSKDNVIVRLFGRNSIMKISAEGKISYITEDMTKGVNAGATPNGNIMAIDAKDNIYLIAGGLIWKISPEGKVNLYAGIPYKSKVLDGPLAVAQFRSIEFIETDPKGNIYVTERDDTNKDNLGDYYLIRKISNDGIVTTLTNTACASRLKTA